MLHSFILLFASYSHRRYLIVFHWSRIGSKSPLVSCGLDRFDSSEDSRFLQSFPLVFRNISSTPTTIGIIDTQMSSGKVQVFVYHFDFFISGCGSPGTAQSTRWQVLFLLLWFNFQLYFRFLTILHRVFNQDPAWGKVEIICILQDAEA